MQKIGLDKVMWGSDYPHHEGVDAVLPGAPAPVVPRLERRASWTRCSTTTACDVYGFDLDELAPAGRRGRPDGRRDRGAPRAHPRGRDQPRASTCERARPKDPTPADPSRSSPRRAVGRGSTGCASCATCTTTRGSTSTRCASGTAPQLADRGRRDRRHRARLRGRLRATATVLDRPLEVIGSTRGDPTNVDVAARHRQGHPRAAHAGPQRRRRGRDDRRRC